MSHQTSFIPLNLTHLPYFIHWFNQESLRPFLFPSTPTSRSAIKSWLTHCLKYHDYYLILCQGTPIGHTGLKFSDSQQVAELSIIVANPTHWHVGHGTACLSHLESIAGKRHLTHLTAEILPNNLPSLSFFTHHGFQPSNIPSSPNYFLTRRVK